MTPYYFGDPQRPLFAIHHSPQGLVIRRSAVLLCPPIGQEYVRTHRLLRRLAVMLADSGFHVLRFNYSCTGDSAGTTGESNLEQWIADIGLAAQELADTSAVKQLAVVGLRFGATLAALAAKTSAGQACSSLVLWDPVVSGASYLQSLRAMHREMLVDPMRFSLLARARHKLTPERLRSQRTKSNEELLGYRFSRALQAQIEAVELTGRAPFGPAQAHVISSRAQQEFSDLAAAIASEDNPSPLRIVQDAGDWTDLAQLESALLAEQIPRTIVSLLSELD